MRIVGGQWRGRILAPPQGMGTRPTTDRVREALFSALAARAGDDLGGGAVLDAFAGSGALGLEALSRGAASATFVEADRSAVAAVKANITSLGAERLARVVTGDLFSLATRGVPGGPFSLILLDPPYKLDPARVRDALASLARSGDVAHGALVSWEHDAGAGVTWPEGYEPLASKRYGSIAIDLAVYERESKEQ